MRKEKRKINLRQQLAACRNRRGFDIVSNILRDESEREKVCASRHINFPLEKRERMYECSDVDLDFVQALE